MAKQILVIQHAGVMGGSVTTLVQLAQLLPYYGYNLLVCLLNPSPEESAIMLKMESLISQTDAS